jgi:7-carboxy-7-deazaguanine synthase
MNQGLINAIYRATEGEGLLIGTPQVFVRFQGCAIGCVNCDSRDTWAFDQSMAMELQEVLERVYEESLGGSLKRVSITGGDPLHPKHTDFLMQLIAALKAQNYSLTLEAAGTRIVHQVFDQLDFINMDFKTPSTGVTTKLSVLEELIKQYPGRYQIKSVIENQHDFSATMEAYQTLVTKFEGQALPWVLTPAYNPGEEFPLKRFQDIIEWNYQAGSVFRVIGQQHKWIYGPDKKSV